MKDPDEDGYPPSETETLWALVTEDGYYQLDNIPFFVRGIASGDVVAAHEEDGMLVFDRIVRYSGHSTLRVVVFKGTDVKSVRDELCSLGCETEGSHLPSLFSVDVPPDVDLRAIQGFLAKGEADDRWGYEEGCLAQ
jgi:hypothetical protein